MALATSGGINIWLEFPGDTRNHFIDGLATGLLAAGWQLNSRDKATLTQTYTIAPSNGTPLQVGTITYTFKSTLNNTIPNEILVGANLAASLANAVAAITGGSGAGTTYSTPTFKNPLVTASASSPDLTLTALQGGPLGNGIPTQFGPLLFGGFDVMAVAPQNQLSNPTIPLKVGMKVYDRQLTDAFSNKFANTQMYSPLTSNVGTERNMCVSAGRRYQVVANRCQFFCFQPGVAGDAFGSTLMGGIPWVNQVTTCTGEVTNIAPDDVWWNCSDFNGGKTLRTFGPAGVETPAFGHFGISETSFNGIVATGTSTANFRPVGVTDSSDWPDNIPARGVQLTSQSRLASWAPLLLEPLVGYGQGSTSPTVPYVQGQLYDAWYGTGPWPMDSVQYFNGGYWLSLSDSALFGTVWLMVPPKPTQFEDLQASYAH